MESTGSWNKFLKSTNFKRKVEKYLSNACNSADTQDPELPEDHGDSSRNSVFRENVSTITTSADGGSLVGIESSGDFVNESEESGDDGLSDYSPDEWSDQEDTTEDTQSESLEEFLQRWSLEYKITHSALKPLLHRLSLLDRTISTDPRRLLGTPRKEPDLIQIQGGQYWHHGLEHSLRIAFGDLSCPRDISININIDGLPIFKNGTDQLWPILFNVHEEPAIKPMIIGVYYGRSKPALVEEFLDKFVAESSAIFRNGLIINGNLLSVEIRMFICDSPARSFIKGCVNFNSFHGCLKCTTVGERCSDQKVNSYPLDLAPKRTDEGYRNKTYEGHHQVYKYREAGKLKQKYVESPLLRLDINMVDDIIVGDSLHLLHLGGMKKLLSIYKNGNIYQQKWSPETLKELNEILSHAKLPVEIHRQMRSLNYLCHWKGTELASFLNYIGIAVLKPFISVDHYENFLNLFCATTICSSGQYKAFIPVANKLFQAYVENFKKFFNSISSNTHNLVHVAEEVQMFGPLPKNSSYPFENHLFQLKKMVRSGRLPLNQIINRIHENELYIKQNVTVLAMFPLVKSPFKNDKSKFSCIIIRDGFSLKSNNFADKWFLTSDFKVAAMIFATNNHTVYGSELCCSYNLFKKPFPSDYLNVHCTKAIDQLKPEVEYKLENIFCKLVAVTVRNETTFVPLIHSMPSDV